MSGQFLVVTFTGPDRPGIVNQLAAVVREHDGNWEGSRMAALAGRFAGILQVEIAPSAAEAMIDALRALPGLEVLVQRGTDTPPEARRFTVSLTGHDRPGIVREVSQSLVAFGVNVLELDTRTVEAPMTGGLLFVAEAQVAAPATVGVEGLRDALERVAADLMVEIRVTE